jgi:protocatechuate 3,4-dioxygenase beta subunit
LEPTIKGRRLILSGSVMTKACRAVAEALLDFWHADPNGEYDNEGFRLRGHQFTDAEGRYSLETVVPGIYVARTRHIHVKVQAPNKPALTSQIYFPGETKNARDWLFRPDLQLKVLEDGDPLKAQFDFVIAS